MGVHIGIQTVLIKVSNALQRIQHEIDSQLIFQNFNPLSPVCATFLVELCNPISRQAKELESCSNPLGIQQVLSSKS